MSYGASNATDCFGFENASDAAARQFYRRRAQALSDIYHFHYGWKQVPFAVLGLALSLIYTVACFKAIRAHRLSRKSYVLLLNRSLGDVFTCLTAFVIFGYTYVAEKPDRDLMQVMNSFLMGSFWASMTSYVSLSLLKLYAVARPLDYRHNVTMMRCIYLIIFSWVMFLFMTAYAVSMILLSTVPPLQSWSGCKVETCMRYFYRFRNSCVVIVYFLTMIVFIVTVILIKRHQRFARIHSRKASNLNSVRANSKTKFQDRFPLWKLALNVLTFAIFNVPYVIWGGGLLLFADRCFFLRHFNTMIMLLSYLQLSILVRIIMDPILAFITDLPMKRSMLQVVGLQRYVRTFQPPPAEDNSSECGGRNSTTTTSLTSRPGTVRARAE